LIRALIDGVELSVGSVIFDVMRNDATRKLPFEYARVKQLHQKVQDAVVDKMSGGKTQGEP